MDYLNDKNKIYPLSGQEKLIFDRFFDVVTDDNESHKLGKILSNPNIPSVSGNREQDKKEFLDWLSTIKPDIRIFALEEVLQEMQVRSEIRGEEFFESPAYMKELGIEKFIIPNRHYHDIIPMHREGQGPGLGGGIVIDAAGRNDARNPAPLSEQEKLYIKAMKALKGDTNQESNLQNSEDYIKPNSTPKIAPEKYGRNWI